MFDMISVLSSTDTLMFMILLDNGSRFVCGVNVAVRHPITIAVSDAIAIKMVLIALNNWHQVVF